MLACALVYGYLPLYFRACHKKLHQYVGLCPGLWLFTSLYFRACHKKLHQYVGLCPGLWLFTSLYFRACHKKLHQYVGLCPGLWLFTSLFQSLPQETTPICWLVPWSMVIYLSISEPAIRNYTNMLACALVYGYLPLYFRACHKKLHQYVGLCPGLWLFTSLYFRACYKKLHQYVGLCPGLWLFTSLYFRACHKKLHQYVGLCPGLWLFTSLFQSLPQETTPICWLVPWSMVIYLSISEPAIRNYTNMLACALFYGYLPLSISEPATRNYTNMLACALVYGYLPLYFRACHKKLHQYVGLCPGLWLFTSLFQSLPQETTPICWLVPCSMVIYLSLFQSLPQETTPICWLVPWSMVIYLSISEPAIRNYTNMLACALFYGYLPLSISEPATRNYTNMLACALVYGYLPLYFRACHKKLHQYVGLCPGLWLFTSLFQSLPQETTPICWLVPWSMVIYLSISEPATRNYTNMLACALVYGYLPLYFRASSKKLHQYVGLCPGLWLFTSLFQSLP